MNKKILLTLIFLLALSCGKSPDSELAIPTYCGIVNKEIRQNDNPVIINQRPQENYDWKLPSIFYGISYTMTWLRDVETQTTKSFMVWAQPTPSKGQSWKGIEICVYCIKDDPTSCLVPFDSKSKKYTKEQMDFMTTPLLFMHINYSEEKK